MIKAEIEDGLCRLGLHGSDVVEVHSSLSSLGRVEQGAAAVVDALMKVIGPDGGLVMSAYPVSPPLPLTEAERVRGIIWKVRILADGSGERTGLGAVVEELCRRPGVILGQGLHRVCAWGRNAQQLSRGYEELLAVDGRVLLIGVGIDRCSSLHLAETVPIPDEIASLSRIPEDIRRDYAPAAWRRLQPARQPDRRCLAESTAGGGAARSGQTWPHWVRRVHALSRPGGCFHLCGMAPQGSKWVVWRPVERLFPSIGP
jgi:aminoglycoside N3'-acetyltransferase